MGRALLISTTHQGASATLLEHHSKVPSPSLLVELVGRDVRESMGKSWTCRCLPELVP